MTLVEQKAAEAWEHLYRPAMEPAIALDYVQDEAGERTAALDALMIQAAAWLGNRRPTPARIFGGTFADMEAGAISADLICGSPTAARHRLRSLVVRLSLHLAAEHEAPPGVLLDEFHAVRDVDAWLEWCVVARRAIALCGELAACSSATISAVQSPGGSRDRRS